MICSQIKQVLLKEQNIPFAPQTKEVFDSLGKYGSLDDKGLLDTRTWKSWFSGEGSVQPGKVEKLQSVLNCNPPLQCWLDVDWLYSDHSEFEKWLHPIEPISSVLLHFAAIDALCWHRSDPKQGKGSWTKFKKHMGDKLLAHMHDRWQLDFNNRVGLRGANPPYSVRLMQVSFLPSKDETVKVVDRGISAMEAAKKISWFADFGLMPSEQISAQIANLYHPLSPVSIQNFLFYLPKGLDIIDDGALDEWAMDLATVTATHTALLSTLRHEFYISQNLSNSRILINGLIRLFWTDEGADEEFNRFFAWTFKLDEVDNLAFLIALHAARISYRKQMANFGINYSDIHDSWRKSESAHPVIFSPGVPQS